MARIPVYEQRVTPNAAGAPATMQPGRVMSTGEGFSAVGAGLDRVAQAMERGEQVDFALEKDRIETEGRIWAATAASQADLDMAGFLQKHQETAKPGAPEFTPGFLKGYDEYADGALKNAPSQFARQMIGQHLARSREAYGKAAMMFEANERMRYQGQQIDDGVQMSANLVGANPAWFDQEMGKWGSTISSAALPEAAKQKLRDMARKSLVNAAVVSWINRNPANAATVLTNVQDVASPEVTWGEGGQTYKVPVSLGTLEERMRWTEYARRKSEELRQDASAGLRYEIQNVEAMARTGVVPTGPERSLAEFQMAFKNPDVAAHEYARYTTARQTATAVATLTGRSTAELLQVVQAKPAAGDPNFAVTAANQAVQAQAAAQIIQSRQQDPVAYAMQTGDFKLQPLNPGDAAAFGEELKRRTAALPGMAEKYGTASVLAKHEAAALAQNLELLPADKKVERLESIRASISDDTVYASVLNSIRPDSPVTALVGNIAAVGARESARMIARGEDLLNPTKGGKAADGKSTFPMPQEALLRQAWVSAVGEAYRGYPQAESTAYQAFKAYYAAGASQKGLIDPKASPDDKIVEEAIKASTGGVMRWKTDWFGNSTPSQNIILPYGMPADQFRDRVAAEWLRVRDGAGYSKTDVGDIGLYNTGANGEYMVMSGTSWLPGKDGKPVVLKIGPMPAVAPRPAPDPVSPPPSTGSRVSSGRIQGVQ